jgi:5-hydroxyisourate hydrolase
MPATISTHVLDTRLGVPAAGVQVSLYRIEHGDAVLQSSDITDGDGRIRELSGVGVPPGSYRLAFEVAAYFVKQGSPGGLFSRVLLDIEVQDASHYHVPLLISPYAFVSYRGS